MEDYKRKSIAFVCNVDHFFLSHRLPLALHGIEKGFTVYLLTKNTGKKELVESYGIHFIEIPFERSGTNPIHELKCTYLLWKAFRQIRPSIIHNITLKASLLGSLAAKAGGFKKVVNAISGFGYSFTDGRAGLLQNILKVLIRIAYSSRTFHFILQNPDDLKMVKLMNLVPEENLHLIKGAGVDLSEFAYKPLVPKDKLVFLFPARLLYDKGLQELIDAANLLRPQLEGKIEIVLAGDCDNHNLAAITVDELEKLLIPNYISWIGFQANMYSVYIEADVVVLPSYREGLPKSLIEACAVGRPIITTDVPGCRECVKKGLNGLLVQVKNREELASAILYMYEHQEDLSQIGQNSRDLAEAEFSIDVVINKTFDIYNIFMKDNG